MFSHLSKEERDVVYDMIYNIINENLERDDLEINGDDFNNYIEIFKCCYYTSNNEKINYLNLRIDGNRLSDSYDELLKRNIIKGRCDWYED